MSADEALATARALIGVTDQTYDDVLLSILVRVNWDPWVAAVRFRQIAAAA
jgi:hypothetical protein